MDTVENAVQGAVPVGAPPSVMRSGVISQVSRTLVSDRVCSPRPKDACRACAISFLVTGARSGSGSSPTPSTSMRSARADISIRVLKSPRRCAPLSSSASCFRAPCPYCFVPRGAACRMACPGNPKAAGSPCSRAVGHAAGVSMSR